MDIDREYNCMPYKDCRTKEEELKDTAMRFFPLTVASSDNDDDHDDNDDVDNVDDNNLEG